MSGDCSSIATTMPRVSASNPYLARVYPISLTLSRTSRGMSMYFSVVISPATTTSPVVISVSQATRLFGSFASAASRTESEIWSAILSGWPSVTDSEVNKNVRPAAMTGRTLPDGEPPAGSVRGEEELDRLGVARAARVGDEAAQGAAVVGNDAGDLRAPELDERVDDGD